jgi:hypothetical protein
MDLTPKFAKQYVVDRVAQGSVQSLWNELDQRLPRRFTARVNLVE